MKNMGLERLVLVNPRQFPHSEAIARASGADDVLANARLVTTVAEAVAGCGFIVATTSRSRDQYFRVADVREAAERVLSESRRGPAAVLFGSERAGLTNEQLEAAHLLIRIPASEAYPSLNLAMAVQIVAYELFRARGVQIDTAPAAGPLADPEEMERLYGTSRRCWRRSTSATARRAAPISWRGCAGCSNARRSIATKSTSCAAF